MPQELTLASIGTMMEIVERLKKLPPGSNIQGQGYKDTWYHIWKDDDGRIWGYYRTKNGITPDDPYLVYNPEWESRRSRDAARAAAAAAVYAAAARVAVAACAATAVCAAGAYAATAVCAAAAYAAAAYAAAAYAAYYAGAYAAANRAADAAGARAAACTNYYD